MRADWVESKIGSTTNIFPGIGFPKNIQGKKYGELPFYKVGDISKNFLNNSRVLKECDNYVDTIDIPNISNKIVPKGTVVFAKIGEGLKLNRRAITYKSSLIDNNTIGLKAIDKIMIDAYLFHYFNTIKLEKYSQATTVPSVRKGDIENIPIPLPPLPEQRAIVKKIEALFSSLDAGIADLKKAQEQLKIYRQAVLKKAFEGELTKGETYKKVTISSVVELNPKPDKSFLSEDLICQFIPMKHVEERINKIHLVETKPYKELQGKSYTYFANNDVIFAKVTPCMENGKIAVAKDLKNNIAFGSSEFHVLRPNEKMHSTYLFHFIVQDKFRIEAERNMTGAVGLRRVPKKFIEDYLIPLPSLEEQAQIVKEIESRLSVCDAVEQQIKDSLNQAEALRQSILKKAFEGRLLSEAEVEACKQEPDYEPAAVLLEKIKAEKKANKPNKKTKKKKEKLIKIEFKNNPKPISTDIHAGLISKVINLHEGSTEHSAKLNHIKCEKISHLVEYHLQIPLGRNPVKDAAGPDDYPHLQKVQHRAKMANYFKTVKQDIGYTYISLSNSEKAIEKFEKGLSKSQLKRVDDLLQLFLPMDMEQAEIVATLYASWNNLIIRGNHKPTDDAIIKEARSWSSRKLKFSEERFYKALEWMKRAEINLIPMGFGEYVDYPKNKK